jgi:hypothetical protein
VSRSCTKLRRNSVSSPAPRIISSKIVQYFIVSSLSSDRDRRGLHADRQTTPGGDCIACDRNEEEERQHAGACSHEPPDGVKGTDRKTRRRGALGRGGAWRTGQRSLNEIDLEAAERTYLLRNGYRRPVNLEQCDGRFRQGTGCGHDP